MQLVKGWRTFWRWWSTWLVLVGSTIITFAPQLSEALLYAWQIIPLDIKAYFPPDVVKYTGYAIAITGIPAKLVRQRKLYESEFTEDSPDGGV